MVLRTSYSFEFFPPKDVEGEDRLWVAIDGLKSIAPDFVSVTYGAGGSTRDRSIRIAQEITKRTGISTVAHLTCVGSTRDELIAILHSYKEAGITSILALRGDPTGGPRAPWTPTPGGLNHADELVTLAAEVGGFTIGVAAFPDGHPASGLNLDEDIEVLLRKEKAGASFATTQFFFEVDKWKNKPLTEKKDFLKRILLSDVYFTVKEAVILQLKNETFEAKKELLELALATNNWQIRQAVASSLNQIPADFREQYETLLNDKSYQTQEIALYNLWNNFPENSFNYLDLSKDWIGFNDYNLRTLWLSLALSTENYSNNPEILISELIAFSSVKLPL